jgi:hypothetical protein
LGGSRCVASRSLAASTSFGISSLWKLYAGMVWPQIAWQALDHCLWHNPPGDNLRELRCRRGIHMRYSMSQRSKRMVNSTILVLIGLLSAGLGVGIWSWVATTRDFRHRFVNREDEDICSSISQLWPEHAEVLIKLWPKLESALKVPRGKLRLTDRFDCELKPNPKWSLYQSAADVWFELHKVTEKSGIKCEINDVRGYLETCVQLLDSGCSPVDLLRKLP